jgi:TetR/AcrR family transcriptional repressor of nem operon
MVRTKEFDPDTVLGRALDAFWERGYEKTSLQDLVDRMGIGRRSLYDTFGDKHSLFLQALHRYAAEREAEQRHAIDSAADARQAVRALLESAVLGGAVLHRGCLIVNTATEATTEDGESCAAVRRLLSDGQEILREVIERGQREGSIAAARDAATLTTAVHNAWLGLRVRVRAGVGADELLSDVTAILTLLD